MLDGPQRMIPNEFVDPLTLHIAPSVTSSIRRVQLQTVAGMSVDSLVLLLSMKLCIYPTRGATRGKCENAVWLSD